MKNHKQIPMKSKIFFKEPPMVCMNQECGGILIFLANSPLKFAWIGIYGKNPKKRLIVYPLLEPIGAYWSPIRVQNRDGVEYIRGIIHARTVP